ncbi:hypothetical protein CCC_03886 [Paramagnetospirillum magnetotacticum MS-1]|uniref:Pilus formation protein N-terminal domain-containing protein n=1 Tax=Paramagnetospirillum magnetotacticum MS-1 TaxID=272627 RepID=A0A0C2YIZ2_PARME|nr:pilus assembly protein N-terminal domain-containing protein [Paramagnetospirillum magnetotacticum]KIL99714.1 hypothetical protein CCC_03886 [Paramagnetospirillum magnetotacticum MS-1]
MNRFLPPLLAALVWAAPQAAQASEALELPLGGAIVLPMRGGVRTVVVGNPAIADVSVDGPGSVTVFGKGPGATSLVALDAGGGVLAERQVVVLAGGANSVTLRYGTGKTWVPGGATAIVDCGVATCAPANTLSGESPFKAHR